MQQLIIGVRFQPIGKTYHFDASAIPDIQVGEFVIVDTSRGTHLGEVTQLVKNLSTPPEGNWKKVERRATPRDLLLKQTWECKQVEATINCRVRLSELKLTGIKVITAEFNYDGSRLAFILNSEGDEKIELKTLRRDMQNLYPHSQVEIRQIGPRDVAKYLGGMGACGQEKRCCAKFLTDFSPISIKMAKVQGISLTPSEITGMCGRLRCCLIYEFEQYAEARKTLPKRNKRVITPRGEGKVVDLLPLKQAVLVEIPDLGRFEFHRDELQPWDELEALRRKSLEPSPNDR